MRTVVMYLLGPQLSTPHSVDRVVWCSESESVSGEGAMLKHTCIFVPCADVIAADAEKDTLYKSSNFPSDSAEHLFTDSDLNHTVQFD